MTMSPVCPTWARLFCTVSGKCRPRVMSDAASKFSPRRLLLIPPFVDGGDQAFDCLIDRRSGAPEVDAHVAMALGAELLTLVEPDSGFGEHEMMKFVGIHAQAAAIHPAERERGCGQHSDLGNSPVEFCGRVLVVAADIGDERDDPFVTMVIGRFAGHHTQD